MADGDSGALLAPAFQEPTNEPDGGDGDTSGVLLGPEATVSCAPDGTPLAGGPRWTNHVHASVFISTPPVGFFAPRPWWDAVEGGSSSDQPALGSIFYISNAYIDDLGQVRDVDGDGLFGDCNRGLGGSDECIGMVWDVARPAAQPMAGTGGLTAPELAEVQGFGHPTGLVFALRGNGPVVLVDHPCARCPLQVVQVFFDQGVFCAVGASHGVRSWSGWAAFEDELCQGVPAARRFVTDNGFQPQAELGEYTSQLRWSWLPRSGVGVAPEARLELHYLLAVPMGGLAGFPDRLALGDGAHCTSPAVRACAEGHVLHDWVDVTRFRG